MTTAINCDVSLSKKIRSLVNDGESVTLIISNIQDGKGKGQLFLERDSIDLTSFLNNETSIMLTPVDIEESNEDTGVSSSNIFGETIKDEAVVKKIAQTKPIDIKERSQQIKKEAKTPQPFKQVNNPACQEYIMTMQALISEINAAKNKKIDKVDPNTISNPRERAIAIVENEQLEGIGKPAYVVNSKVGSISINDLGIVLPLNSPLDLGRISAKKLSASRDLHNLFKDEYLKFISPQEANNLILKGSQIEDHGLKVFDRHEEAEASITYGSSEDHVPSDIIPISEEGLDKPFEEESMIMNLTQGAPIHKQVQTTSRSVRATSHGNTRSDSDSETKHVTIRRRE